MKGENSELEWLSCVLSFCIWRSDLLPCYPSCERALEWVYTLPTLSLSTNMHTLTLLDDTIYFIAPWIIQHIIWAEFSIIVPSNKCKMRRFRSSCAFAKYHPGISSPFIHSVVSDDSDSGQERPRSDCADAQSDLGLRCLQMREDMFPHGAVHLLWIWKEFGILSTRCKASERNEIEIDMFMHAFYYVRWLSA